MTRETHLYRHLDAEGRLLYVGISLSALNRLSQHKTTAHWFASIAKVTIETFPSHKEALEAEKLAIKTDNPAWNISRPKTEPPYREFRAAKWPRGRQLTERRVQTAMPGSHNDGDGLRLVVSGTGRKKWLLRYRDNNGVYRDKGLGSCPEVRLKDARDRAFEAKKLLAQGGDLARKSAHNAAYGLGRLSALNRAHLPAESTKISQRNQPAAHRGAQE